MKTEKNSSLSSFTALAIFGVFFVTFFISLMLGPWLKKLGFGPFTWLILPVIYISVAAFFLKRLILHGMAADYELVPMTAREFAQAEHCSLGLEAPIPSPSSAATAGPTTKRPLDFQRFESFSTELLSAGFRFSREGQLHAIGAATQSMYVRLYEHPSGSLAAVMQLFAPSGNIPVTCIIQTAFEDDWSWADSNMKRNWLVFMMRRPRALGKAHPVGTGVTEMWASCSRRSDQIEHELGIKRIAMLAGEYELHLSKAAPHLKTIIRRKNILAGILEGIFIMPKTTEWWGEYAKYANKAND